MFHGFSAAIDTQIVVDGTVFQFTGDADFDCSDRDAVLEVFTGDIYNMDGINEHEVEMNPVLFQALADHLENSQWLCDRVVDYWNSQPHRGR